MAISLTETITAARRNALNESFREIELSPETVREIARRQGVSIRTVQRWNTGAGAQKRDLIPASVVGQSWAILRGTKLGERLELAAATEGGMTGSALHASRAAQGNREFDYSVRRFDSRGALAYCRAILRCEADPFLCFAAHRLTIYAEAGGVWRVEVDYSREFNQGGAVPGGPSDYSRLSAFIDNILARIADAQTTQQLADVYNSAAWRVESRIWGAGDALEDY